MIKKENVLARVSANDWREAIREVGNLLVNAKSVTPAYVDAMIEAVEEMGPYIVIMPGFALAHAAPSEAVLANDAALITLKEGVDFGSTNDPVHIVFCVSCVDKESHKKSLQQYARLFLKDEILEKIKNAQSANEIVECL